MNENRNETIHEIAARADEYLNAMEQIGRFSGATLLARNGAVMYRGARGLADREHGVPNSVHSRFRIASISKQFTAMAILILAEQGKLDVGDPIRKHLPYSPEHWSGIRIHHLLNHTSGLIRAPETDETRNVPRTVRQAVGTFVDRPLDFRTGTEHRYSNAGYMLLGDIIERLSGDTYGEFLREQIFGPLGMADTGCYQPHAVLPDRACGYRTHNGSWMRAGNTDDPWWAFGAGSLYSTVDDLYRWDQALLAGRLVSAESHRRMNTATPLLAPYGYGVGLDPEHGRRRIWHAGGLPGYRAQFCRFVEEPACVIVLCNSETSDFFVVAEVLGAILLGEKYALPSRRAASVPDDVLASYAGVYEILPGVTLRVSAEPGRLVVAAGDTRCGFYPGSDGSFFRHENGDDLTFRVDATGAVNGLLLRQSGVEAEARRIACE